MATVTSELIQAQAANLRGAALDARRAQELADDMNRLNAAAGAARDRLDFNDEPARFAALLAAPAKSTSKRK